MFAAPLGLLALLAVPAIVALHLFRRRFRPREVSALFLWADIDRTPLSGRKREKLRRSWSLLAECLAALCLALACAGLRGCGDQPGEHLVLVLDASASMGARASGEKIAERALRELGARIDDLPRGSRVTIVQSGAHPTLLAGPAAFPEEARDKLAGYAPLALRHDLSGAVAFALQVSGGGRVLVLTDRYEPERLPPEVEIVALGEPLDNVAITHASRERVRERVTGTVRERAAITLTNFSPRAARTQASVRAVDARDRELVDPKAIELAPGEKKLVAWDLPAGTPPIVIELAPDALEIDGQVFLAAPPARTLGLFTTLAPDEARLLGLSSGSALLDRLLAIVEDGVEASSAESAHLVIGRAPGGAGRASWYLSIEGTGSERKDWIGPFLFERRHPLLEGLTLEGIVWSSDPAVSLAGVPLVAAGNVPLLVEDEVAGQHLFRLNLDPARSTLARSPDWPIFLTNLCELRRRSLPGPGRTNLLVGDELEYRASGVVKPDEELRFAPEDGSLPEKKFPPRPALVIDGLDRPGMYTLKQGSTTLARVAVSFVDAFESDLRGCKSGRRPAQGGPASIAASASWMEALLLGLAVLAILLDWVVLRGLPRLESEPRREEPRGLPAP